MTSITSSPIVSLNSLGLSRTPHETFINSLSLSRPKNHPRQSALIFSTAIFTAFFKEESRALASLFAEMVVPPPVRPPTITKFLKPYVLKMHFTNKYVSAQVVHSPTATVASSASSQEKALRESLESHRDVAAAAKIGKILGERLLLKNIPAVSVHLKREQKYHGKVKAVIDNVVEAGVKLL